MKKRGLSNIFTVILLLAIVLVAIAIFWNIFDMTVRGGAESAKSQLSDLMKQMGFGKEPPESFQVPKKSQAPQSQEPYKPADFKTENLNYIDRISEKTSFIQGEIIVKFKSDPEIKENSLTRRIFSGEPKIITNKDSVNNLNKKYHVRAVKPLFKDYEKENTLKELQVKEDSKTITKKEKHLLRRLKRAPKNVGLPDFSNIYIFGLEEDEATVEAVAEYNKNPNIEYAQLNYIYELYQEPLPQESYIPNDYYIEDGQNPGYWRQGSWEQDYQDMWGLRNIKAIEGWNLFDINGDGAIKNDGEKFPGEGIVVAVLDTGADYEHEDLAENIWINDGEDLNHNGVADDSDFNDIDDDENGYVDDIRGYDISDEDNNPSDYYGHGTHCSGTIAAIGDNSKGITGVAYGAKIMPVKIFPKATTANCAEGIRYAVENGADVLSNSWGMPFMIISEDNLIRDAIEEAYNTGAVVVFAAGNNNNNAFYFPETKSPFVIPVASTDHNDEKSGFSNWGNVISVAAPGGDYKQIDEGTNRRGANILSLRAQGTDMYRDGLNIVDDKYIRARGTSMACPHVAGLAAVILSKYPELSNEEVHGRIMAGADNIDSLNPGFEGLLGTGRINVYNSLTIGEIPVIKITNTQTDGEAMPGGSIEVFITLKNFWKDVSDVTSSISTDNPLVSIENSEVRFGNILSGETKTNSIPFKILFDPSIPLSNIDFIITINAQEGYTKSFAFTQSLKHFMDMTGITKLPVADAAVFSTTPDDYNNDGYTDLFFVGFLFSALYKNDGFSGFSYANQEADLIHGESSISSFTNFCSVFIDIDNDGDKDFFVGGIGSFLFLNNGDGAFTDISETSEVHHFKILCASALDYNNDGYTDLIVGGAPMYSDHYTYFLFRNNKDNTFIDVTSTVGLDSLHSPGFCSIIPADYNNDGRQDLLFTSSKGFTKLFHNDGSGRFSEATIEAGIEQKGVKSAAAGDYNNDGYIDIFLTGIYDSNTKQYYNALYKNNGDGTFRDVTSDANDVGFDAIGLEFGGTAFFDYNNDGYLDLHIASGLPDETPMRPNSLWKNNGDGTFQDVTEITYPSTVTPKAASAAIFDYDNDGDLDIYAPTGDDGFQEPPPDRGGFLKNLIGNKNNWVKIKISSEEGNIQGTKIYVKTGAMQQMREIHTSIVDNSLIHFGLGKATLIDEIMIQWPSSYITSLKDVEINKILTISQPEHISIIDEGQLIETIDTLSASWKALGYEGVSEYQYKITQGSPTGAVIKDWASKETDNSVTETDLPLLDGETYYFSVKAKYEDGKWSDVFYSDGIEVEISDFLIQEKPHQLVESKDSQFDPEIYEDKIVWSNFYYQTGRYDIYMYDISTGEKTQITDDNSDQRNPAVYEDKIVWDDNRNGNWETYMYDILTREEKRINIRASSSIYRDRIVFSESRMSNWDIYMYDISTGEETRITTDSAGQHWPAIYKDKIVWDDNRNGNSDIYMYDISTGEETQITTDITEQQMPKIYQNRIVWRSGDGIYMYDISTGEETQITTTDHTGWPELYENRIVWANYDNSPTTIYIAEYIYRPKIYSLNPNKASVGSLITIEGIHFGDEQEDFQIELADGVLAPIELWSDNEIVFKVPANAVSGAIKIITPLGTSNLAMLEIVEFCEGDVNKDGVVNIGDLTTVRVNLGQENCESSDWCDGADIDRNGVVNVNDLTIVRVNLGEECISTEFCGDNIINGNEVCDGNNLAGQTCETKGFDLGTLSCLSDCSSFNTDTCYNYECGNNIIERDEICDGNSQPCTSPDGYVGSQQCNLDCNGWQQCILAEYCGDNIINGNEVCDGTKISDTTCQTQGFIYGILTCLPDCSDYDTSKCFFCQDNDKDGYDNCNIGEQGDDGKNADCNDANAEINPGVLFDNDCDAYDNDCDSYIDEDYIVTETSCGVGECANNKGELICVNGEERDTCNPNEGAINENCEDETGYDGLDNNCDSIVDLDCESYCDKDRDNYSPHLICVFAGYSTGDCNDANAEINPGHIESCDDGIDNNCNNVVDENCCRNGLQEGDEECDGTDLRGETCKSIYNIRDGELSCNQNCKFNSLGCIIGPCEADINKDGIVDVQDAIDLGTEPMSGCKMPDWCEGKDVNRDGVFDANDGMLVTNLIGQKCEEPLQESVPKSFPENIVERIKRLFR